MKVIILTTIFIFALTLNSIASDTPDTGGISNFSGGIAAFTLSKPEIVNATIENGIVRVTEKRSFRAGPWLQANWVHGTKDDNAKEVAWGLFVGTEISNENKIFRSIGIGVLMQFRRGKDNLPINLGIGPQWTSIQVLGSGLIDNQSVPTGVESIRYRTETHPGVVMCVSFGF